MSGCIGSPHLANTITAYNAFMTLDSERLSFFVEAAMSLPNIAYNCTDFAVVFEAVDFSAFFDMTCFCVDTSVISRPYLGYHPATKKTASKATDCQVN